MLNWLRRQTDELFGRSGSWARVRLAAVDAAIDAIPDQQQREECRVEWDYAPYVERTHPMLLPLASALGLTTEQVDDAFREASAL